MNDQKTCKHEQFGAQVNVNRMEDTGRFIADITIKCVECDLAFEFVGPNAGIAWDRPTVSIDGTELHTPIEPCYQPRLRSTATYQIPPEMHGVKH